MQNKIFSNNLFYLRLTTISHLNDGVRSNDNSIEKSHGIVNFSIYFFYPLPNKKMFGPINFFVLKKKKDLF
jgi:hypothetical protein